jgi:hypothetical protein
MADKYGRMFDAVTEDPGAAWVSSAHCSFTAWRFTSFPQHGCAAFTLAPRYKV